MQYRHPRPEEYAEIIKLSNVAYRDDWRGGKTDEEIVAEFLAEYPDDSADELRTHFMAWTDDDKLMAKVSYLPLHSRLNDTDVTLAGIGGVATYAEYRRGGYVRHLMQQVLETLYRERYTLSYLYPFNHEFYRKFSYETHTNVCHYQLNIKEFETRYPAQEGTWVMLQGPDDPVWAEVKQVYESYATTCNLMVKREDKRWARYQSVDPYKGKQASYLFRDMSGEAAAYFTFETRDEARNTYRMLDLAYRDTEALLAVLEFARRFRSDYEWLSLPLPENHMLMNLVTTIPSMDLRQGMIRIIRAEDALACLDNPFKKLSAKIKLELTDPELPGNSGCYRIELLPGEAKVRVSRYDEDSDQDTEAWDAKLTLRIKELSVLVCGAQSFTELIDLQSIDYEGDTQILTALFPRRPNLQLDFY